MQATKGGVGRARVNIVIVIMINITLITINANTIQGRGGYCQGVRATYN